MDYINDEFLMKNCQSMTKKFLDNGMDLDMVVSIIKEYQTKYIYLNKINPEMSKTFTPEMWWECRKKN